MSEEDSFIEAHIFTRYDIIEKLGKGAYGVVWKATDKSTNEEVALKKIFNAFQNATDSQRTYREVFLLKEMEHENIIKLHKIIRAENGEDLYLVFEYMDSDLHYAIRTGILEEDHKRYIIYQLLKSILFIHSSNVVHRDLKPENLLLNTSCQLKVADFGLARSVHETEGSAYPMTEYVATRWYRAPEIVLGSSVYTKGVDMWAIGCIIAELYSAKPLFPGKSTIDQLTKIMEVTGRPSASELDETAIGAKQTHRLLDNITRIVTRSLVQVVPDISDEALDLINKLLKFSPKDRLTVEEAIAHPYVEKFRDLAEERSCDKTVRIPIDDNTRKSVDTYREELYKLSDIELVPSSKDNQPNSDDGSDKGSDKGSEKVNIKKSDNSDTVKDKKPSSKKTKQHVEEEPPSTIKKSSSKKKVNNVVEETNSKPKHKKKTDSKDKSSSTKKKSTKTDDEDQEKGKSKHKSSSKKTKVNEDEKPSKHKKKK
jgi:mitogen-activated protein kinase 15